MKVPASGGGWQAIVYTLAKARQVGPWGLWKAMRSRNACKTCALGMGGQAGGMVNERGRFPEVCKKSLQAMAADMQGAIRPEFFATYALAQLQRFSPRELESCGRLTTPLVYSRGGDRYEPIGWDEALARIVAHLRAVAPDETFWYSSGRSSNEAGFLTQLLARLYGTNNVNNCSYYCHQASGVGLTSAVGTGTATIVLEDLEHADLVMLIGGNPASNHPRLMTMLMDVRRRGGTVIVINPVVEAGLVNFRVPSDVRSMLRGSPIASMYVQPHIGGDLALLTGVAKRLDELDAVDREFVARHCEGGDELLTALRGQSWEPLLARAGVGANEIDQIARLYAASRQAVFSWTMGITHHVHGVENVQAIANLALLRGMVGRPHAGLLPIRGHSNVQGIGTVGFAPQLKQAVFERLEAHFGIDLPKTPGLDTLATIEAAHAGRLRAGICVGGNLYGSNPDSRFAAEALAQLDLLVYLSTTLNTGHAHGLARETIVLPVLARDEEPQPTTQESMFNFVRLSDGGPRRHEGPRSETEVIAALAEALLEPGPIDWRGMRQHRRIRQAMARVIPGLEPLDQIDATRQEFQIAGRTLDRPPFATPSGRARLHVHEIEPPNEKGHCGANGETSDRSNGSDHEACLRLMTVRSEGQFNTVVYEEHDLYRGQERRDVILVHPDDIARLGLVGESRVGVHSAVGRLDDVVLRPFPQIKPGNVLMYYPEANVLVPREADPRSRTPAFKSVTVWIEAAVRAAARHEPALAAGPERAASGGP